MTLLRKEFQKHMLPQTEISKKAADKVLNSGKMSTAGIKKNFSSLVQQLEIQTYQVYMQAQENAWKKTIRDYLEKNTEKKDSVEEC